MSGPKRWALITIRNSNGWSISEHIGEQDDGPYVLFSDCEIVMRERDEANVFIAEHQDMWARAVQQHGDMEVENATLRALLDEANTEIRAAVVALAAASLQEPVYNSAYERLNAFIERIPRAGGGS